MSFKFTFDELPISTKTLHFKKDVPIYIKIECCPENTKKPQDIMLSIEKNEED